MIDIDDPRYIKDGAFFQEKLQAHNHLARVVEFMVQECALMSQKLIRLHYDQQIIDYTPCPQLF